MLQALNSGAGQPAPQPIVPLIKCRHCEVVKGPEAFYNGHKKNGKESWCKACVLERKRLTRRKRLRKARTLSQFRVIHNGQPDERLFVFRLKPVLEG